MTFLLPVSTFSDETSSMLFVPLQSPEAPHCSGRFATDLQEKYLQKCEAYNALQSKLAATQYELQGLLAQGSLEAGGTAAWGYSKIAGDSNKVAYYTGLPNDDTFKWIVSIYRSAHTSAEIISHEDQVLLVLMRLRLDIPRPALLRRSFQHFKKLCIKNIRKCPHHISY